MLLRVVCPAHVLCCHFSEFNTEDTPSTEVSLLQAFEMVAGRIHFRMVRGLLDEKTFAELVATHECS